MSKGTISLSDARKVANKLINYLRPHCERIEVCGSIRRLVDPVGDVEIAAIPNIATSSVGQIGLFTQETPEVTVNLLDQKLDWMVEQDLIIRTVPPGWITTKAWGDRYKKFWLQGHRGQFLQVDLFIVLPPAQWGSVFSIRTGPKSFNQALMRYINQKTKWQQTEGYLVHQTTGEIAHTPEESDYFAVLGLPTPDPVRERTKGWLYRQISEVR